MENEKYLQEVQAIVTVFEKHGFQAEKTDNHFGIKYEFDLPSLNAKFELLVIKNAEYGHYQLGLSNSEHSVVSGAYNTVPVKESFNRLFASWNVDNSAGIETVKKMVDDKLQ